MKRIEIQHTTRYNFDSPVKLGPHTLLVRPRQGHDLRIVSSTLNISPTAVLTWRRDLYDNMRGIAAFGEATINELAIESCVEVELYETMPLNFVVEDHALYFPFNYLPEAKSALLHYLTPNYADDPLLEDWLTPYRQLPRDTETFAVLDKLNHQIHTDLGYQVREEAGVLTPTQLLAAGKGSCRDMAALFLETCRRLGIAARFVSGYVHGPATEVGGASTHAWAEVYLPGAGWKGFDPTNCSVVGPDHIPTAVHSHPESIPPISGSFTGPEGVKTTLSVDVQINQLAEA